MAGRHAKKRYQHRSTSRRKLRAFLIAAPSALILAGIGIFAWSKVNQPIHDIRNLNYKMKVTPISMPEADSGRRNILLIGTDARPGETDGNTDVLILASIDNAHQRLELLSIPRDTKVQFPDGSSSKINEAFRTGGPQLVINLVSQLTGQPVNDYAITHFSGVVDVINTIGGIQINVPERMYYNTGDKEYNIINLKPGLQTLNGEQALGFVRFRHDALGDIGRTGRQQAFIAALAHKLLSPTNIPKLPELVRTLSSAVETDLTPVQITSLAANARQYKDYPVLHETLPGSFHNPDAEDQTSYWITNPIQAKWAARQLFEHGLIQKNPVQDPSVTANWKPPAEKPSQDQTGSPNGPATTSEGGASSISASSIVSVSSAANTPDPSGTPMVVSGIRANIRSGPGGRFNIIGSLSHGAPVAVLSETQDWCEVRLGDGSIGYVANWLLGPTN